MGKKIPYPDHVPMGSRLLCSGLGRGVRVKHLPRGTISTRVHLAERHTKMTKEAKGCPPPAGASGSCRLMLLLALLGTPNDSQDCVVGGWKIRQLPTSPDGWPAVGHDTLLASGRAGTGGLGLEQDQAS